MTIEHSAFPLEGIMAVVSQGREEVSLAASRGLSCVEIRADLLLASGLPLSEILAIVKYAKKLDLKCLFTLRHISHGGVFDNDERERVTTCLQALASGADIIDLEWGTIAADMMLAENASLILSHHDFEGMLNSDELHSLSEQMIAKRPAAVKIIPTANTISDSLLMLKWVEGASDGVERIGFAMGEAGSCSRILTMSFGGPVTYASFSRPVAPGQLEVDRLINDYRLLDLDENTRVYGLIVNIEPSIDYVKTINDQFQIQQRNIVCIPFKHSMLDDLIACAQELRLDEIGAENQEVANQLPSI